jgi:hypothetical protein
MRYLAGAALIVVGLFVAVLTVSALVEGGIGSWSTRDVAFVVLYAALADATIALGVLLLQSCARQARGRPGLVKQPG